MIGVVQINKAVRLSLLIVFSPIYEVALVARMDFLQEVLSLNDLALDLALNYENLLFKFIHSFSETAFVS